MRPGRTYIPRIGISVGLFLMAAWNAAAASTDSKYAIQFWNARSGLPEESVYAILETPDGYLWLATRDRLVRFDGKTFQAIDPAPGQLYRDTGIGSLAWDGQRLWVGARDRWRCEQQGMQGHLSKPVSIAALQEALSSLNGRISGVDSHRD